MGVAHGWNIDLAPSPRAGSPVLASRPLGGRVVDRGRVGVWGCLARCWVLRGRAQARFFMAVSATGAPDPLLGGGWVLVGGLVGAWSRSYRIPLLWVWVPVRIGCRLYVENYTVDASIFVAKFLRAHGGCLGTRNRRRT